MLSRPPAALAASMSARPGVRQRRARSRAARRPARSGIIDVRPSLQMQVDVAVARRPRVRVGLDRRLGAERARDDRALRVVVGLLRRELALADELLDERVVVGQALEARRRAGGTARLSPTWATDDLVLADVGERSASCPCPARCVVGARQRVDARVGLRDELGAAAPRRCRRARAGPAGAPRPRAARRPRPPARRPCRRRRRTSASARRTSPRCSRRWRPGVGALEVVGDAQHQWST